MRARRVTRRRLKSKTRAYRRATIKNIGVSKVESEHNQSRLIQIGPTDPLNALSLHSRTLYGADITNIPPATVSSIGSNVMNIAARLLGTVKIVGLKYRFIIRNNLTAPVWFNYALISFKNSIPALNSIDYPGEPYTVPTLATDGFFRYNGQSRDENFDNSLPSSIINFNPISSDQYVVHMHKRRMFGPLNATTEYNVADKHNYGVISGYFPINRIVRYNDDIFDTCETPVYLLYWLDRHQSNLGESPLEDAMYVQQYHYVIFNAGLNK